MKDIKTEWVKMKPAELEEIVLTLHKEGNPPAKIGLILRDKYAVPKTKTIGKKITHILKDAKLKYQTEKDIFQKKIELVQKHISAHKHDYTAKRSLTKSLWTIKKLK
jgi:small subunit ribosomal protein S15